MSRLLRLASSSSTRAKILDSFKVNYIQSGVNFNEELIEISKPRSYVYAVATNKLNAAVKEFGLDIPILVADTVVTDGIKILRKAKTKIEAKEILLQLSGSKISIITATILKSKKLEFIDVSTTNYTFNKFDTNDLNSYLESNLWQGKAGACMVEGFCKKYIKSVEGLESNAMGLPIEKIMPWLEF
jgi:septum formation protein